MLYSLCINVLQDEGFQFPSNEVKQACETAKAFTALAQAYPIEFSAHADQLCIALLTTLTNSKAAENRSRAFISFKEMIYRITGNVCCDFIFAKVKKRKNLNTYNFHNTCILYCACSICAKIKSRKNLKLKNFATQTFPVIRYSENYRICWQRLSNKAKTINSPLLNYHLTYRIYEHILNVITADQSSANSSDNQQQLTLDETAAITCVGGFIVRTSIKKITRKNPKNKNDLLYLLFQLLEDPDEPDDLVSLPETFNICEWTRIVDRGGLFHCTQEFIAMLVLIEKQIKNSIEHTSSQLPLDKLKTDLMKCTSTNSTWTECFATSSEYKTQQNDLFKIVINEYLTLRGFSFTSRWMEKYKYKNKKNITKTKSLRTKLQQKSEE